MSEVIPAPDGAEPSEVPVEIIGPTSKREIAAGLGLMTVIVTFDGIHNGLLTSMVKTSMIETVDVPNIQNRGRMYDMTEADQAQTRAEVKVAKSHEPAIPTPYNIFEGIGLVAVAVWTGIKIQRQYKRHEQKANKAKPQPAED